VRNLQFYTRALYRATEQALNPIGGGRHFFPLARNACFIPRAKESAALLPALESRDGAG